MNIIIIMVIKFEKSWKHIKVYIKHVFFLPHNHEKKIKALHFADFMIFCIPGVNSIKLDFNKERGENKMNDFIRSCCRGGLVDLLQSPFNFPFYNIVLL